MLAALGEACRGVCAELHDARELGRVAIVFRPGYVELNEPYLLIAASAREWADANEAVQLARARVEDLAFRLHSTVVAQA